MLIHFLFYSKQGSYQVTLRPFTFSFNFFFIVFVYSHLHTYPLSDCRLVVVERLVCFYDPESLAGGGVASGRYNQTGKIKGEIPDQSAVTKSILSCLTRACTLVFVTMEISGLMYCIRTVLKQIVYMYIHWHILPCCTYCNIYCTVLYHISV